MLNKSTLHNIQIEGFKEREIYSSYKIFFGAMVSESRLKIINLLRDGKKSVNEIARTLKILQPSISHDLARLKQCGIVIAENERSYKYYTLNNNTIQPLMKLIDKHKKEHCIHILKTVNKGDKR